MAKRRGKGRDTRLEGTWRRRLARQGSSGLTVREFCERGGVPEASFYHWRRELAKRDGAATQRCSARFSKQDRRVSRRSPLFLPVHVKDGPSTVLGAVSPLNCGTVTAADGVIEVRLPSGYVLRGEAVEKLARLAVLLGGRVC